MIYVLWDYRAETVTGGAVTVPPSPGYGHVYSFDGRFWECQYTPGGLWFGVATYQVPDLVQLAAMVMP